MRLLISAPKFYRGGVTPPLTRPSGAPVEEEYYHLQHNKLKEQKWQDLHG